MNVPKLRLAVALTVSPMIASAHGPEGHSTIGRNGGQVTDVGGHHVEFVVKDKSVAFYITGEQDTPESTKAAVASVIYLANGVSKTVALVAEAPNRLAAKLDSPVSAGTKMVITGKLADGHDLQARFVSK